MEFKKLTNEFERLLLDDRVTPHLYGTFVNPIKEYIEFLRRHVTYYVEEIKLDRNERRSRHQKWMLSRWIQLTDDISTQKQRLEQIPEDHMWMKIFLEKAIDALETYREKAVEINVEIENVSKSAELIYAMFGVAGTIFDKETKKTGHTAPKPDDQKSSSKTVPSCLKEPIQAGNVYARHAGFVPPVVPAGEAPAESDPGNRLPEVPAAGDAQEAARHPDPNDTPEIDPYGNDDPEGFPEYEGIFTFLGVKFYSVLFKDRNDVLIGRSLFSEPEIEMKPQWKNKLFMQMMYQQQMNQFMPFYINPTRERDLAVKQAVLRCLRENGLPALQDLSNVCFNNPVDADNLKKWLQRNNQSHIRNLDGLRSFFNSLNRQLASIHVHGLLHRNITAESIVLFNDEQGEQPAKVDIFGFGPDTLFHEDNELLEKVPGTETAVSRERFNYLSILDVVNLGTIYCEMLSLPGCIPPELNMDTMFDTIKIVTEIPLNEQRIAEWTAQRILALQPEVQENVQLP